VYSDFRKSEGVDMKEVAPSMLDRLLFKSELSTKIQKFRKMGYTGINEKDLLDYLVNYRWKNHNNWSNSKKKKDILAVQAYEFFDYQRILAQTSKEKIDEIKNLRDLF
jgi:hypothetical protein